MQTIEDVHRAAAAGDLEAQALLAEVFDELGRPEDALLWLRRAADGGLASAAVSLGLREIVGRGAPQNTTRGLSRIVSAAERDAEAAHMAAVLHAGGVGAPRRLDLAVDFLIRAARAGHGRAACQLALLIGDEGTNAELARSLLARSAAAGFAPAQAALAGRWAEVRDIDWEGVGRAVDLSRLRAPYVRVPERESPRIETIPDFLPAWACAYVVALAAPVLERGKVVDEQGGESVRRVRTNSVMHFGLGDSDVVLELINQRAAEAAGAPPENGEGLGVLHYRPGETYAQHVDYIDPAAPQNAEHLAMRGQRNKTLLVYLNDDFEGGETAFVRLGLKFKPPAGTALLFESVSPEGDVDPRTLHAGLPPTSGEKWLISKWFRTQALRPAPTA